uniref:CSON007234 protein n=1 Tax=Culicoides sonorensis TaxID=179676 RepID=A0A336LB21_CULSO
MSTDRLQLLIFLFITLLFGQKLHVTTAQSTYDDDGNNTKSQDAAETGRYDGGRAIYSPQLEYTEWVPLGRGDPLKNDPTYDYSPPKIDFVKYWADGTGHKEKGKTDILLLGVPQQRHKEPTNKHMATRRNFAYNDLPTMLMPPPPAYQDNVKSGNPIESYKMPVQPLNWNNNRKSIIDTYVDPVPAKTYTTIFRPILSSTIYQYHHTYKAPSIEGPNLIDTYHKSQIFHDNPEFHITHPPSDLYFASDTRKPAVIKSLEGSPFAKPSDDRPYGKLSDSVDAQSINYAFTYQTTTTEKFTTEKPTTTYRPSPPPTPETTTAKLPETTTSMYARFRENTKTPKPHMSLVIEGHSKVKTYKPGHFDPKEKHRPVLVPIEPVADPIQRRITDKENGIISLEVKHLHSSEEKKSETKKVELEKPVVKKKQKSAISSLLSFLDTSFGDLDVQEESSEEFDEKMKLNDSNNNNIEKEQEIFRNGKKFDGEQPHFVKKRKE